MPEAIARTHVGRQRDRNEDAVLEQALESVEGHLLVVADGMGGHRAGHVASRTAIETLEAEVADALPTSLDERAVLGDALATANERIQERAGAEGTEGMGTTVVAALVEDGEVVVVNVGDSRAYVVDDGIEQVTVDQTVAREMVREGALEAAELDEHPHRHVLSQALGSTDDVEPAFYDCVLEGGTLVLCSDGLPEEVPEESIEAIVGGDDSLGDVADALIDRANENGGSDNISVVLYRERADAPSGSEEAEDGTDDGGGRAGDGESVGIAEKLIERGRRLIDAGGE